jgi:hypothetical protein
MLQRKPERSGKINIHHGNKTAAPRGGGPGCTVERFPEVPIGLLIDPTSRKREVMVSFIDGGAEEQEQSHSAETSFLRDPRIVFRLVGINLAIAVSLRQKNAFAGACTSGIPGARHTREWRAQKNENWLCQHAACWSSQSDDRPGS